MKKTKNTGKWWRQRKWQLVLFGVVWCAVLFGAAVPSWQRALIKNKQVRQVEAELAVMDQWSVAGMWLAPSVEARTPRINARWEHLFPTNRQCEALFLDLARIADKSGVISFDLTEIREHMMDPTMNVETLADESTAAGDMAPGDGIVQEQPLSVEPDTYRVKASFGGDYSQLTNFLGSLQGIDRALSVHSLIVRPTEDGILVDLELDVYVSKS